MILIIIVFLSIPFLFLSSSGIRARHDNIIILHIFLKFLANSNLTKNLT